MTVKPKEDPITEDPEELQDPKGDNGETSLVCTICIVFRKLLWFLVRLQLLLNTWSN